MYMEVSYQTPPTLVGEKVPILGFLHDTSWKWAWDLEKMLKNSHHLHEAV